MALAEEQVSPEEKLLKVIQEGGEEPEEQPSPEEKLLAAAKAEPVAEAKEKPKIELKPAKPAKVVAAAKKPTADDGDQPAEDSVAEKDAAKKTKPKLKVKEGGKKKPKKEKAPKKPAAESAASAVIGAGPVLGSKKRGAPGKTLKMINGGLVAAAVVMLLLSGWEMWGAVKIEDSGETIEGSGNEAEAGEGGSDPEGLYDLQSVVATWQTKQLMRISDGKPPEETGGGGTGQRPPPEKPTPWSQYVKKNFTVGGWGGRDETFEVVLKDSASQLCFYAKPGKEFMLNIPAASAGGSQTVKLKLDKFDSNRAYISDGKLTVEVF